MKRILVISYYFPPANHIATQRSSAMARYFPENGLEPVFATRHWSSSDRSWDDYFAENPAEPEVQDHNGVKVLRFPFTTTAGYRMSRKLGPIMHRAYLLIAMALGRPQPELDIHRCFLRYLRIYLSENRVDHILATFQPMGAIKLAHTLSAEYGIPFTVDFRDMWNVEAFGSSGGRIGLRRVVLNRIQEFYLKRWMKAASLISAVNKDILERVEKILPDGPPTVLSTNGFESALFEDKNAIPPKETFIFSVVGTLYPKQDLSVLFGGLNEFLAGKSREKVRLQFVGLRAIPEADEIVRRELPSEFVETTDRVPYEEAVAYAMRSHVLFYAGWKGTKGITPGKIFDYLGARRNILIAPGDVVLSELMDETRAGKVVDSPEEFAQVMETWYREWLRDGTLRYEGREEKITGYSRRTQTAILARAILSSKKGNGTLTSSLEGQDQTRRIE